MTNSLKGGVHRLGRSAGFLTLRARRLGEKSGSCGGQLARGSLSAVPVQELAVCPGAVQPLLRCLLELLLLLLRQLLLKLFLGLGSLLFGLLQSLLLRLGFQAQLFGPRLGALLLALLFARRAFAADRLQIRLEVVGAIIVVDLSPGSMFLIARMTTLRLRALTSDSAFGLQA